VVFQQGAKPAVVRYGHIALITALLTVSVLMVGVVAFVFDVVVGGSAFWWALILLAAVIVALWVLVPALIRVRAREKGGAR
jgi:hypothetical protein